VKLAYLCELLRPTYEFWTDCFDFIRYHYGPYAGDILTRIDFLVFHRLVDVREYTKQVESVHATYEATEMGVKAAAQLADSPKGRRLAALTYDVIWSLQTLGVRSAKDICDVVYSEPYFNQVLDEREGLALLSPQDPRHPSYRLLSVLEGHPVIARAESPQFLVRAFLSYLATRDSGTTAGQRR
jgi:hypothetical protein